MWTPEDRALVGDYGSGQALSDDQYRLLEPLIPAAKPGGRPRTTDTRRVLDGLFYVVRTGCQWRHLPPPLAFPAWPTVYGYMRGFLSAGVWESMRHHLVVMLREGVGREASPTAAIIDTQSVKTTESGGPRSYDAAKKVNGRKRHIAVDTQGLLLGVLVHIASIQDADGAGDLLRRIKPLHCWLRTVFADGGYSRVAALLACFLLGITLIIVGRIRGTKGFVVLPRRWVVERTIGWLGRWQRLSKDYEQLPEATHKHPKVLEWLARHPRWTFHSTPTSSSWLNAVEGFFARLAKRRLKRGVFHSLVSLQAAIKRFVAETNDNPVPFRWTKNPDEIIAALRRGHQALDSIH